MTTADLDEIKYISQNTLSNMSNTDDSDITFVEFPINRYVVESYNSGYSWYRVWSDGFIEQGGKLTPSADNNAISITFAKAFTYEPNVITTVNYNTTAGYTANTSNCTNRNATLWACTIGEPTTTGFVVNRGGTSWSINWYACGY